MYKKLRFLIKYGRKNREEMGVIVDKFYAAGRITQEEKKDLDRLLGREESNWGLFFFIIYKLIFRVKLYIIYVEDRERDSRKGGFGYDAIWTG